MNSCLAFSAAERSVSERRRRGPGRKTDFCFLILVRCYQDLTLCISCLVFNLFASTEILFCELSTSMWCFAHASWRLNVRGHIGSGVYTCTHACNKPTSKTKAAPQSAASASGGAADPGAKLNSASLYSSVVTKILRCAFHA